MGWLFGWNTRKELADHLISGNGVHTLKHCFRGNNLWAVQEGVKQDGTVVRFIALYLIKGRNNSRDGWGYKDMDESAGPCSTSCPLGYIEMVEAHEREHGYRPVGYTTEWRTRVRELAAKKAVKLVEGQKIKAREDLMTEMIMAELEAKLNPNGGAARVVGHRVIPRFVALAPLGSA
jgi:hypothetical protein